MGKCLSKELHLRSKNVTVERREEEKTTDVIFEGKGDDEGEKGDPSICFWYSSAVRGLWGKPAHRGLRPPGKKKGNSHADSPGGEKVLWGGGRGEKEKKGDHIRKQETFCPTYPKGKNPLP